MHPAGGNGPVRALRQENLRHIWVGCPWGWEGAVEVIVLILSVVIIVIVIAAL